MEEIFKISDDYIELNKLLKVTGLCSTGGETKIVIEDGLVTVDGEIELRKRRKIRDGMVVRYEGNIIKVVSL